MKGYFGRMLVVSFVIDHPYTRATVERHVPRIEGIQSANYLKFTGWSRCSESDPPIPNKGKKLALARALVKTSLNKEQRAKVWAAFHNCSKNTMIVNLDEKGAVARPKPGLVIWKTCRDAISKLQVGEA